MEVRLNDIEDQVEQLKKNSVKQTFELNLLKFRTMEISFRIREIGKVQNEIQRDINYNKKITDNLKKRMNELNEKMNSMKKMCNRLRRDKSQNIRMIEIIPRQKFPRVVEIKMSEFGWFFQEGLILSQMRPRRRGFHIMYISEPQSGINCLPFFGEDSIKEEECLQIL